MNHPEWRNRVRRCLHSTHHIETLTGDHAVAGMERLERCARCLRARLVAAAVRRRLPWLLLGLVFLGSALKDGDLVPETPMQNKRNVFNV